MNTLPFLVEFLGTFLLLISILATGNAFIIGATLALIILLVGGISGAHVNPAVCDHRCGVWRICGLTAFGRDSGVLRV